MNENGCNEQQAWLYGSGADCLLDLLHILVKYLSNIENKHMQTESKLRTALIV